jgi:hypothetical protein
VGELEGLPAPLLVSRQIYLSPATTRTNPFAPSFGKPPRLMRQTRCQIAAKNKMSRQIGGEEVD